MFAILIVFLICSFVTLWIMMFVTESNEMSFKEYFTGKDISKVWQDGIIQLQTETKKQEERITKLETYIYIAEANNV